MLDCLLLQCTVLPQFTSCDCDLELGNMEKSYSPLLIIIFHDNNIFHDIPQYRMFSFDLWKAWQFDPILFLSYIQLELSQIRKIHLNSKINILNENSNGESMVAFTFSLNHSVCIKVIKKKSQNSLMFLRRKTHHNSCIFCIINQIRLVTIWMTVKK